MHVLDPSSPRPSDANVCRTWLRRCVCSALSTDQRRRRAVFSAHRPTAWLLPDYRGNAWICERLSPIVPPHDSRQYGWIALPVSPTVVAAERHSTVPHACLQWRLTGCSGYASTDDGLGMILSHTQKLIPETDIGPIAVGSCVVGSGRCLTVKLWIGVEWFKTPCRGSP